MQSQSEDMSDPDLLKQFKRGVYIHAPDQTLTHFSGCLIEGLVALGVPVRTNATQLTSRPASMPLDGVDLASLHSDPLTGFAAYLIDISSTNASVPVEGLSPVAYITTSDISVFCEIPQPHLLFAAHGSRAAVKPGRRIPIAFGLTERLIARTESQLPMAERDQNALHSFRPTLQQGVRALLDLAFVPDLQKVLPVEYINIPPGHYIEALKKSAVCLCYGGDFYSQIQGNGWFDKNQPELAALHRFQTLDAAAVLRWDSWRFWEALAAGCVAVHLDFEKYGFDLPVMPEPWVHYVPLDLADLKSSAAAVWDRREQWPDIGARGRAWAVEHYAPQPTAKRVLQAMAEVLP